MPALQAWCDVAATTQSATVARDDVNALLAIADTERVPVAELAPHLTSLRKADPQNSSYYERRYTDVRAVLDFQQRTGFAAVVTGVHQLSRFGELGVDGDRVTQFVEKPGTVNSWINGGYFVMTPKVFDYIAGPPANPAALRGRGQGRASAYHW